MACEELNLYTDATNACRRSSGRTATARCSYLGSSWAHASSRDRWRALQECPIGGPWMERTGRLRLVFSVYHARLRCRQSFGLGCTPDGKKAAIG